jgi:hypothetical protein
VTTSSKNLAATTLNHAPVCSNFVSIQEFPDFDDLAERESKRALVLLGQPLCLKNRPAPHWLSLEAGENDSQPILRLGSPSTKIDAVKGVAMAFIRNTGRPLFELGFIVGTPGAIRLLESYQVSPIQLLCRHQAGDWGDVDQDDLLENNFAVGNGLRILSVYRLGNDHQVVWVITECDRSVTTLLLPEEY